MDSAESTGLTLPFLETVDRFWMRRPAGPSQRAIFSAYSLATLCHISLTLLKSIIFDITNWNPYFELSASNLRIKYTFEVIEVIEEQNEEENESHENIGARRLQSIMELLLEDISFNAGGDYPTFTLNIDSRYVDEHLQKLTGDRNLKKYVL